MKNKIMDTQEKLYEGFKKIILKRDLINEISLLIKETHNEQDILDLQTFDVDELKEILTDLNNN
tara:strand:- start:275 stop:466 length:192 start_codon:yes stop_codon:yes gene_type:complete